MQRNELGYTFNEVFQHQYKMLQECYKTLHPKEDEKISSFKQFRKRRKVRNTTSI